MKKLKFWNNFFSSLLVTLGVSAEKEKLARILAKIYSDGRSFECFEDVHEVLSELKAHGLKLGMISNAFPSAEETINRLELRQYFDHILLSYEYEYIKPEPQIYQLAVKNLDTEIDKSIFVDDRWTFVKAAIELGMDAYLIERITPYKKDLKTMSLVPRVSNLYELRNKILGENKCSEQSPSPSEIKRERESMPSASARVAALALV